MGPLKEPAATPSTTESRCCALEQAVTRRELADALGVHYQTIGYLERGEYSPSLNLALRIAEFFDVPVETVFSIDPFPRISDNERTVGFVRLTPLTSAAHVSRAGAPGTRPPRPRRGS